MAPGQGTTRAIDLADRQIRLTDALDKIETSIHNVRQNVATVDPLMRRTSFVHDAAGRRVAVRDGAGDRSTTLYDAVRRSLATIDALDNRVTDVYDADSRRIAIVDARSNRSTLAYDAAGRRTSESRTSGSA